MFTGWLHVSVETASFPTIAWQNGKNIVNGGGWWSWNPNSWTRPSNSLWSYLHALCNFVGNFLDHSTLACVRSFDSRLFIFSVMDCGVLRQFCQACTKCWNVCYSRYIVKDQNDGCVRTCALVRRRGWTTYTDLYEIYPDNLWCPTIKNYNDKR